MTENEVRKLLADFCRNATGNGGNIIVAQVKDVDKNERTCTILDDGTEYYGVRLQPIINATSGVVLFPKKDAHVLVSQIEGGDMAIIAASEYDSITLKLDGSELLIDKNGIVANNGDFGGIIKIDAMIKWMGNVYNDLQNLKKSLNDWTVAGNGAPLALVFNTETEKPQRSNFEDTRFKH